MVEFALGGTIIVSAAVEGDHVTSSKKNCHSDSNARHSHDIIAASKALSCNTPGHRSSSGKNSGNSIIATGNGNFDAKSGSFNFATATSPITEATNATSGFCHSRSTGVLAAAAAIKWNGIGTGSEGGIVRQGSPPGNFFDFNFFKCLWHL